MTMADDHAGIKRASAVSPQASGPTKYVMRSPNVHTIRDHIGSSPLKNTTGSGKGGHVMIKTNKHITKPSKKLINPNNGLFKRKELDV